MIDDAVGGTGNRSVGAHQLRRIDHRRLCAVRTAEAEQCRRLHVGLKLVGPQGQRDRHGCAGAGEGMVDSQLAGAVRPAGAGGVGERAAGTHKAETRADRVGRGAAPSRGPRSVRSQIAWVGISPKAPQPRPARNEAGAGADHHGEVGRRESSPRAEGRSRCIMNPVCVSLDDVAHKHVQASAMEL